MMTSEYEPAIVKPRPYRLIGLIAGIVILAGICIAVYSAGYSQGSKSVDQLQVKIDDQAARLTNQNHTINNLSETVLHVEANDLKQAMVSACRQHRSQFEKIMDSNQSLLLVNFIALVVNKPTGVDLATNPQDVTALQAYEKAATDYRSAVLASDQCL